MWRFSFFSSLVFTWTGAVWRLFHTLFVCSALARLFSVTVCAHLLDLSPQERNFDARFHNTFTFSSFAQWSFSFFYLFSMNFFSSLSFFFFILFCLHRGNFCDHFFRPCTARIATWGIFFSVIIQNYYPDCDPALCTTTHKMKQLFFLVDISGKLNIRG